MSRLNCEKLSCKSISSINIYGGISLNGTVSIDNSKNSTLQLMATSILLQDGFLTLHRVPQITDVFTMKSILEELGLKCIWSNDSLKIGGCIHNGVVSQDLASEIRASIVLLGAILTTYGEAFLPLPGGDKLGSRPVDIHLDCLREFGVDCTIERGIIHAKAHKLPLEGTNIFMRFPSVLATGNLIMAATLANGITTIQNAACEPEIVDLAVMLNRMGARITGAGTKSITIHGVNSLHGIEHEPISDRIETGTLLTAIVMTGGSGILKNCIPEHNTALISHLRKCGAKLNCNNKGYIEILDSHLTAPLNAIAMPYPGLPTDLQPLLTSLSTQCPGTSIITDTIYPDRFAHISELQKLGATISHSGNQSTIVGKTSLQGAIVEGNDIRCVAALLCASLAAEGESTLKGMKHLFRGHANLLQKLVDLNASIDFN